MIRCFYLLLLLLASAATASGADWPAWRGPTGQGYCEETNLPLKWDAKSDLNIKWKVPLQHPGNSTPIVWKEKILLTQANKGGTLRYIMCFDRADGKMLWKNEVNYPDKEQNWTPDWYANASPTTDGERVYACFASAGLYCYDLNGKEVWKRTDLGKWEHQFGNGSSPVLYNDLLIQCTGPNAGKGRNDLMAFDKKTGKTVWETKEKYGSWSTPVIAKVNGKDQLLLAMSPDVKGKPDPQTGYFKGYDPKTGKELWHCRGVDSYQYTSPLVANGIAVQMSGYQGSALAVKLGGSGDITRNRLWHHPPPNIQRVGTGIIVGEHVYMLDENCLPHCYELTTGKDLWKNATRPQGSTWSSMVLSGDRLYLLTKQGDTYVIAANPKEFKLLATNRLGDPTNASIAPSNGELFIRTARYLWCISEMK
jgi:outer membrane protein assembly factor BamB